MKAHSPGLMSREDKNSGGEVKVLLSHRTQIMNLSQAAEMNLVFS